MQYRNRTHQQNWVPKEVDTPAGDLDTDGVGVKLMVGVMLGDTLIDVEMEAVAVAVASQN